MTKNILQWAYGKLKRTTNASDFMAQIDGLRFIAIFAVVFAHINTFIVVKSMHVFETGSVSSITNKLIHDSAHKGVLLFFVISGFILGLPYAKHYLLDGRRIELRDYFMRRLTRLEPPYILNNIAFAILIIFFAHHSYAAAFNQTSILTSLFSALTYSHNIFFQDVPALNSVTWSLEIEIQFYILVPLLVLLFKPKAAIRRGLFLFVIAGMTCINHLYSPDFISIYDYIQYFLSGFLIVDLYLSKITINLPKYQEFILGLLSLTGMVVVQNDNGVISELLFIGLTFVFSATVILGNSWRLMLSHPLLTSIGGMCYTIYLWHMVIISGFGNFLTRFYIENSYIATLLTQAAVILPSVILFSSTLYILIEKPCMDKHWPSKCKNYLLSRISIWRRSSHNG